MTTTGTEQDSTEPKLLHELQGAANVSRLLAQLYRRELTLELAAELEASEMWSKLAEGGYDLCQKQMQDADFIQELRLEYARVFLGPGKRISPYGSVHHPDDIRPGQLWGSSTQWIRRFVKDHGVDFDGEKYDGIPDHIGHEMEIYALLVEAEMRALEADDLADKNERIERLRNSQRLLVEKQWLKWLPIFCGKVMRHAELPFYRDLSRLALDFMHGEAERLGCATEPDASQPNAAQEGSAEKGRADQIGTKLRNN